MVITATYIYVQPFKQTVVNILEAILSINTLILLLIRNTDVIRDSLDSFEQQPPRNKTICQDDVEGVTDFSWLLLPDYYLPLVICCTVGGVWVVLKGR